MNHPARELVDIKHLAEVFSEKNIVKLADFESILESIQNDLTVRQEISSVNVICKKGGSYVLMNISSDDYNELWNFTTGK